MVLINRDVVATQTRKRLRDTVSSWLPPATSTTSPPQPAQPTDPLASSRPPRLGAGAEVRASGANEVGDEVRKRLIGRKRTGGLEGQKKQAEADDQGQDEEEGSKVALLDRQQRLKAVHSTAQQAEGEHDKKKKRKRNSSKQDGNTAHSQQRADSDQHEDGTTEQEPAPQQHEDDKQATVETTPQSLSDPPPASPSAIAQSAPSTTTDLTTPTEQQPKKTRQGQPQQFVPFVRGKQKRKGKRSRQKNIRKDNRPDHLKPNYLTVLPRPNRTAQQQQQSKQQKGQQQQSGLVDKSGSRVNAGNETATVK